MFLEKAAHHIIGNPESVKTVSRWSEHCCLWLFRQEQKPSSERAKVEGAAGPRGPAARGG